MQIAEGILPIQYNPSCIAGHKLLQYNMLNGKACSNFHFNIDLDITKLVRSSE